MNEVLKELGTCMDILSNLLMAQENLSFTYTENIEKAKKNKNIFQFKKRKEEIIQNQLLSQQSDLQCQKYKDLFYYFSLLKNYVEIIEELFTNLELNDIILCKKDFMQLKFTYQVYQDLLKQILDLGFSQTLSLNVDLLDYKKVLIIIRRFYKIVRIFSVRYDNFSIFISPCDVTCQYDSYKEIWVNSIRNDCNYMDYVAETSVLGLKKEREKREKKFGDFSK